MGKRYYCDYCDKTMSNALSIIKTHNNGLSHKRAKYEHFQKFKDPEVILAEESKKKPCSKFPNGQCQFGGLCKFSHYSPVDIQALQKYVATKKFTKKTENQPCFQDLYEKFQSERAVPCKDDQTYIIDGNGVAHIMPWTYNSTIDKYEVELPPSIQHITIDNFKNVTFNEWG